MAQLPTPGFVGRGIRVALGLAVGWLGLSTALDAQAFFDGVGLVAALPFLAGVSLASSWVINELLQRRWGQRPLLVLLAGLAAAVALGYAQGEPFGPWFGAYLWVWVVGFAGLLAPALLLAAALGTPGCEMRSYRHLWVRLRGGDADAVACPGWIDRFDHIRMKRRE